MKVKDPKTSAVIKQFPQNFALRLKLRGSTVGSHMWQSVKDQVGTQHNWHDDRKKWNTDMRIKKQHWNVKYWAYFTGGDDDVEYVFQEKYPLPVGNLQKLPLDWRRSHLNVLSYNIYMRPLSLFKNGQMIRAKKIPDKIPGYDVIVFQEAFDDDVRSELLNRLKKGYPHQSRVLGSDRGIEQDGGVIIVSKWPIMNGRGKQRLFGDVCSGDDCLADKGVLYVKINKEIKKGEKNYFHIFGTHLNNGNWGVQKKQLKIIRNFIDTQKIPESEGVLIAGDMNIRKSNTNEYNAMLNILGAGYFSGNQLKGHPFSHDGTLNDLGEGSQSYLDYVLHSTRHQGITKASFAEVRLLRSYDEWKEFLHESAMWDLSDHFPVYANYHFHYNPLEDWDPGLVTSELSRYWKEQWSDVVAIATKEGLDEVKGAGYQRVGAHGRLFKTKQEAEKWTKPKPVHQDAGTHFKKRPIPLAGREDSNDIKERGIRKFTIKPSEKTIKRGTLKKKTRVVNPQVPEVLPLKLYFSELYKDYLSTTSVSRGEQAVKGPGKYKLVGTQGYVFNHAMVYKMPLPLKSRTIVMYSYYNSKTRDNLIATSSGDIRDAEKSGYKRVALEGYLIKKGPPPPKYCKTNKDCPSGGFRCDAQRGVCVPDIR